MTVIALLPILVCIIGLLLYVLPLTNPKVTEVGRLAFFAGLLITLLDFAGHVVRIGGRP